MAGLESGKDAIDAATIMAIRLGGACLEVLYANDGELLKQYCACSTALYNEVLGVSDSHRQSCHRPIHTPRTHAHPPASDRRWLGVVVWWTHCTSLCPPFLETTEQSYDQWQLADK